MQVIGTSSPCHSSVGPKLGGQTAPRPALAQDAATAPWMAMTMAGQMPEIEKGQSRADGWHLPLGQTGEEMSPRALAHEACHAPPARLPIVLGAVLRRH